VVNPELKDAMLPVMEKALSPADGALTTVFAAAHPDPWRQKDVYAGAYLLPFGAITIPSEDALSSQLAADLWAASEHVLKNIGA
jgi:hypothetical protein